ncbi:MAG: MOP flippase family protein [Pseudomonadota bacterium]
MDLKQQAVTGARWTTISTVVTTLLQLAQFVILARLLAPEAFGLMAILLVIVGFAQIFSDLGISDGIIHKQQTPDRVLSTLYWINLAAALVVVLLMVLATPLMIVIFSEPRLAPLLPWIALSVFVAAIGRQFQIVLQRELRFRPIALAEIAGAVMGITLAVLIAAQTGNAIALVYGHLAQATMRSLVLVALGSRTWHPRFELTGEGLADYLNFGFWQVSEQVVNFVAERVDQILIGALLGAQALGFYNLAYNLVVMPVSRINPVITRVAFPVFARLQQDQAQLRAGYLRLVNLLSLVNFPLLVGLAAVAGLLVPTLFGTAWQPAVPVLQLLALVMLFRSLGNPSGSLMLATGKVRMSFFWNLGVITAQVPIVWVTALAGGITGVALGLLLLQLVYFYPFYHLVLKRLIDCRLVEYLGAFVPLLIISLAMGLMVHGGLHLAGQALPGLPTSLVLALAVLSGALIQLGLCLLFARRDITYLVARLRSR